MKNWERETAREGEEKGGREKERERTNTTKREGNGGCRRISLT